MNRNGIEKALQRLNEARTNLNRIASLRMGVISGGPSIDDEKDEFEAASKNLRSLLRDAVRELPTSRRLRFLRRLVQGEIVGYQYLDDRFGLNDGQLFEC